MINIVKLFKIRILHHAMLVLFLSPVFPSHAQEGGMTGKIRAAMDKGDYATAQTLMSEYLKAEPENPDAWTLHANLILNEYRSKKPTLSVYQEADEDIYNRAVSGNSNPPVELPALVADSLLGSLLKAAALAPNRMDIHYGICDILSKSGKGKLLVQYIPVLNASMIPASENPYLLAEYARNMIDRKRFEDGMQVYSAIVGLYPDNAGILSDMAGEYYQQGNLKAALLYAKMSMDKPDLDETTLGNCFFLAAIAEDDKTALDALQKQCALKKTKEYLVYDALLQFESGKNAGHLAQEYLRSPNREQPLSRLSALLGSKNFKASLTDFDSMMNFELPDAYKMVICRWFSRLHPQAFAPSYYYGEINTFHKKYDRAASIFKNTPTHNADSLGWFSYHLHAGYADYKSGQDESALFHFQQLLQSEDFYEYAAGAYFSGVIYLKMGDKTRAEAHFKKVASNKSENKYALYSSWLLE